MQSDIVGFTKLGSRVSPEDLCGMLHNLFSDFDEMCDEFLTYKIETIVSPARFFPSPFFPRIWTPAGMGPDVPPLYVYKIETELELTSKLASPLTGPGHLEGVHSHLLPL